MRSKTEASITVATLNLLNDLTQWPDRAPLVVDELRRLQPDLIALQEVALPANNAQWLADQVGGYSIYLSPKAGKHGRREALAILSRLPVESHETLPLGRQGRVAQRVIVRHDQAPWEFVNTHLYWSLFDDATRLEQVQRLLAWLPSDRPTIVCGDFNAQPHYAAIAAVRRRFDSAHVVANGREPDYTCPTPLHRGPGAHQAARRTALHLGGMLFRRSAEPWRGTLDYIFIDRAVQVRHCRVAFHQPAPHNPRLYPSDHLGLTATLRL